MLRSSWLGLVADLVASCLLACSDRDRAETTSSAPAGAAASVHADALGGVPAAERPPIAFVGSETCVGCHPDQAKLWQESQHRRAMLEATRDSVAAPFAGETLREGEGQVAFVGGPSGEFGVDLERAVEAKTRAESPAPQDALRVSATFGIEPLQQYLLEAADGRTQVLPWAFDTRPRAEGGQRWIHLYPEAGADESHPLHFSRSAQNWNHVCADCHVTAYRKRFTRERGKFESRWQELGVGCEACHGPGEAHALWAASEESEASEARDAKPAVDNRGLATRLDERRGIRWSIDPTTGNAVRSAPRTASRELEVCAPCHARRSAITEDWAAGEPFLDHYRPMLLEPGLYHADGQQRDEVYGWGSFLQSRMHAKGVTCGDCHEPHSGELRAQGDALCGTCHAPSKYASAKHHHHAEGSSGSACIACHMPTTTYMQVDPRHDHSLRVPRPDQAVALGVPDACGACHGARRSEWAARAVEGWLGRPAQGFAGHAEAFQAGERRAIGAGAGLRAVASDSERPAIVRASALARLVDLPGPASATLLVKALEDPDALVRIGALEGLASADEGAQRAAAARLGDARRAVRFEAVRLLAPVADALAPTERASFEREAKAYVGSLARDADRAEAQTQRGVFLAERGDLVGAREALEAAIAIEPTFEGAHVNLADLARAAGQDAEALGILDAALVRLPESAALHHARGLALVRLGRAEEALPALAQASELAPDSVRFGYVHAVALEGAGARADAILRLEGLAERFPGEQAVREALIAFLAQAGDAAGVARHREALARIAADARG